MSADGWATCVFELNLLEKEDCATIMKTSKAASANLHREGREIGVQNSSAARIEQVIAYIENHLDGKLELDAIAEAAHYSKYHLHRMFVKTVGITIHDYAIRRQLTEAAKLLVFSSKPVADIALICGYESQQAFTCAFKAMYKRPPAEYRERGEFYPLQLRFHLQKEVETTQFTSADVRLAEEGDIPAWMALVKMVVDGYPHWDEADYFHKLQRSVEKKEALILMAGRIAAGIMAFSREAGSIEFMGVHPQYRHCGIPRIFLEKLIDEYLPRREISMTTFRENDKADPGYRELLKQLGFAERELLVEFGYPTQRFVFPSQRKETR